MRIPAASQRLVVAPVTGSISKLLLHDQGWQGWLLTDSISPLLLQLKS